MAKSLGEVKEDRSGPSNFSGPEERKGNWKGVEFMDITEKEGAALVKMARKVLEGYVADGVKTKFPEPEEPGLLSKSGMFVTLHKKGALRGCIGYVIGIEPLYEAVTDLTISAAAHDPRFYPVRKAELGEIDLEISVMTEPQRVKSPEEIIMGTHGVIVRMGGRQGVYLPQVATETGWSREEFLDSLCESKAGIPRDAWRTGKAELWSFTAKIFSEKPGDQRGN